jgi:hypothetical protein
VRSDVRIDIGTSADDADIRGLLRREPLPGRIAISYEREPDFSIGCDATGENATVLVAREADTGETIGVACRSEREVYTNGEPVRLGYLGQLRIDRRYRGRWLVSRGYARLRDLHDRDPLPAYLAAVTAGNREAEGILVTRPRRFFPRFHRIADYCTLAIRVRRHRPTARGRAEPVGDLSAVTEFLRTEGPRRQFFPVWNERRLASLTGRLGLRIDDVYAVSTNGRISGVMGLWDQSTYKQHVVRSYTGWMRVASAFSQVATPLLGHAPLPRAGEHIRQAYAAFTCVADEDTDVFDAFLGAVLRRAAARGLDYLLLGMDARDPLLPVARERPHVLYTSTLYLAEWPDGGHLHARLDSRPAYVELATL